MSVITEMRNQIQQAIDRLDLDQLGQLLKYVQQLTEEPTAPLYHIHEQAIATGVADLAEQHDRYLYGQEKDNA
jgi:hypothetical protein